MKREELIQFLKWVDESTYWKEDNDVPNTVIVDAYLNSHPSPTVEKPMTAEEIKEIWDKHHHIDCSHRGKEFEKMDEEQFNDACNEIFASLKPTVEGEKREMFEKVDIFTEEFLTEIGFILVEKNKSEFKPYPIYGKAKDRTGMTIICWCDEGHSCTYFGEKLQPNTSFSVEKDGGTRYAFNGYAYTQDDVRKILSLTW